MEVSDVLLSQRDKFMTESQSFAVLHTPKTSANHLASYAAQPLHTIHRDIALGDAPFTAPELFATDDSDRVAPLFQIALAALALPAVAYSLTQLWHLISGNTLDHAIRAFFP